MKKLSVVLFMVLSLPVWATMVSGGFVAVAGHVNVGGQPTGEYCTPCGCPKHPECVCDPGEAAGPCNDPAPLVAEAGNAGDGAGALLLLFAAGFTWRMIRRK